MGAGVQKSPHQAQKIVRAISSSLPVETNDLNINLPFHG